MLTDKEAVHMWEVFKNYETKFGVWLYCAWNYDLVDWLGLTEAAEQAIKNNSPLTIEEINKFQGGFACDENGRIYPA